MGDELSAAQISASGQVLSAGINYASSASANRKGRKWAEKMYDRQRSDSLTDWEMQNDYNSPAAQMKRLKAGGLNPNLVYGDGANTPSATIRSSSPQSWKPEAPQIDLSGAGNSLMRGIELKNTEQQTNNLEAQKRLIEQQIIGEAARTQAVGQQTTRSTFDLEQLKAKASTDIEMLKANLRQTEANTQYTLDQNQRSAALQASTLSGALENLVTQKLQNLQTQAQTENTKQQTQNLKHQIPNLEADNALKELEISLRKRGINPGDPAYMRLIEKLYTLMPTPKKFHDEVNRLVKEFNEYMKKPVNSP